MYFNASQCVLYGKKSILSQPSVMPLKSDFIQLGLERLTLYFDCSEQIKFKIETFKSKFTNMLFSVALIHFCN